MSDRVGVKQKLKNAGRLGLKVAIATGAVAGLVLGVKGRAEEKKEEAEELVGAGKVIGGAVADIGKSAVKDIGECRTPACIKARAEKSKQMVVGVVSAGAKDPVGAAAQVSYATAPKTTAPITDLPSGVTQYRRTPPPEAPVGGLAEQRGGTFDLRECDTRYPTSGRGNKARRKKCKKEMRERFN